MNKLLLLIFVLLLAVCPLAAQVASGGTYTLNQTVIAGGGGTSGDTIGNAYKIEGTSGQSAAGAFAVVGSYSIRGGFWSPNLLAPSAAGVRISGRVAGLNGENLRNINVILSGGTLVVPRHTRTNTFGNFTFEDVEAGHIYIVSVESRKYGFPQNSQVFSLTDSISDIIFQAAWKN